MTPENAPGRPVEPETLRAGDALLVVDMQVDFCPDGGLAVPEGDEVVPVLNRWISAATEAGVPVVASRDWHPANHVSFDARGGPWPEHCVQGTPGAAFHPELRLPEGVEVVSKGQDPERDQYSALDGTGLDDWLRDRGIERVWIGGLAQDVCVRASAIDAAQAGFETRVLLEATRPVDAASGERALREMAEAGAHIEGGSGAGAGPEGA